MEKILITGVAGFIGHALAHRLLSMGYSVRGIDAMLGPENVVQLKNYRLRCLEGFGNFEFLERNILDGDLLMDSDIVVHLAALAGVRSSFDSPMSYIQNNIEGFSRVFHQAIKEKVSHFIFASSSSVYGNSEIPEKGLHESMTINTPKSLYAMTKLANEQEASLYADTTEMRITGLRFFSVYGPGGRIDMAPWIFTDSIRNGKGIMLYGDGEMRRDFTYIDDVVDSVSRVIMSGRKSPFEIYNIGSSNPVSVRRLLSVIETKLNKKAMVDSLPPPPGDVQCTYACMDKFFRDYGSFDFLCLEDGISNFCDWYDAYAQEQ